MRSPSCWLCLPESHNKTKAIAADSKTGYSLLGKEGIMSANIKEEARRLVEALPDDSTWEDLMYQIYVRETIESGLADSEAGRVTDVEKVREEFGLSG